MPLAMISLARSWIQPVASLLAGPPSGGLYLNPPSVGGLCDGVTTIPSATPSVRPRLYARIAWLSAGVGVYPSRLSMRISTSLAASTSRAETHAGSDRPWVSLARNSGPSVPCIARYSTIAWVVARMWNSLNEVFRLVPRCPDVPKATRWSMFSGSGCSA